MGVFIDRQISACRRWNLGHLVRKHLLLHSVSGMNTTMWYDRTWAHLAAKDQRCSNPLKTKIYLHFTGWSISRKNRRLILSYLGMSAVTFNWWVNTRMLVWLYRSCIRANTGHVTWRHLRSGFKTARLLTCLFHKQSVSILLNTAFNKSYLKRQDDFSVAFPKSGVPDKWTVFRLLARFRERVSVHDRNVSCRLTV